MNSQTHNATDATGMVTTPATGPPPYQGKRARASTQDEHINPVHDE